MPAAPSDCPGIDDCVAAGPIRDQLDSLHSSVRILAQGHVTLVAQMAEVTVTLRRQDERIDSNAESLSSLKDSAAGSAEMLSDIKSLLVAGRATWQVGKAVGAFVKWGAGMIIVVSSAWYVFINGPKP